MVAGSTRRGSGGPVSQRARGRRSHRWCRTPGPAR